VYSQDINKFQEGELSKLTQEHNKGLADRYVETDEPVGFQGSGLAYGGIPPSIKASDYLKSATGWVYACVSAIADAIAPIEIGLYKLNKDGDIERIESHPSVELLDKVNNFTTKYDHMWLTQQYLDLAGEAPWYLDRGVNGNGDPQTIMLLRPDSLSIIPNNDKSSSEPISGYKYRVDASTTIDIGVSEMVFLKYPDPNNQFRGKGTLSAAARAFDLDSYAEDYNTSFFYNSGRPDVVLSTDQKLTDKQKAGLRSDVGRLYKGRKNAHKTMILESGLKVAPFAITQRDMEFLEQSRFSRDKILSIFRVHKSIIAITEDVNLANAKVGEYVFAKWTIRPKIARIVAQLNEFYLPMFSGTEQMFFAFNDPVPQDVDSKIKKYDSALTKGWMTINEIRSEENLPDVGEVGNDILIPNNLVRLEEAGQPSQEKLSFKATGKTKGYSRFDITKIINCSAGGYYRARLSWAKAKSTRQSRAKANEQIKNEIKKIAYSQIKEIIAAKKKKVKAQKQFDDYVNIYLKGTVNHEKIFITATKLLFENQLTKLLKKFGGKKIKAINIDDYLLNEDEEAQVMVQVYQPLVKTTVKDGGERAAELVNSKFSMATESVKDYLKTVPLKFSFQINETTNEMLRNTLAEGVDNGESIPQLRERVKSMFDDMANYRAERIARTEVIKASNFASIEAFTQSGLVDEVQWLATPDDRLDPECSDLDGKVINLGSSFASGVEYPPLHPNCRCTVVPVIK
jgi:HK97 family phage portal protein